MKQCVHFSHFHFQEEVLGMLQQYKQLGNNFFYKVYFLVIAEMILLLMVT